MRQVGGEDPGTAAWGGRRGWVMCEACTHVMMGDG